MRRLGMLLGTAVVVALSASATASVALGSEVHIHRAETGIRVVFRESRRQCEDGSTFGRISVGDRRARRHVAIPDICSNREWSQSGKLAGGFAPRVTFLRHHQGVEVWMTAGGDNATREYRVVASTKDDRDSGWLTINWQRYWHNERVYEGTDAFVNFCIDQSQEIRSLDGRLFCWRQSPVTGPAFVAFHHRRW